MRRVGIIAVIAWAAVASLAAQEDLVTIEKLLSAPFPSGLTASPSGAKFAWVQNARGVRNIWVAEPPEYRGRQVTGYTRDEGLEIASLRWSPDGQTIVFVRGGRANSSNETPNPTSDPAGQVQALWRVSAGGGEAVRIADGHSPEIAPSGDVLAFVQSKAIWSVPLDGSKDAEKLIQARGTPDNLRWSADGKKLAFVSTRNDHGFIGVYDRDAKTIQFLDPAVDSDRSPIWSPDGTRVAFIRIPADSDAASFRPVREATPWSIVVADVSTGEGKTIWRAEKGRGSAYWELVSENQLFWGANDQIVFPWERDGWVHLYSVDVKGGTARLLTPGEYEVEYAAFTPDRRFIIYNSNERDIDRRHLWRLSLADGKRELLTPGKGIEWSPRVSSDGRTIAFLRSDARTPAHAAMMGWTGGQRDLVSGWLPADFPDEKLVEPEQVIFPAADGMPIHAQLFLPAGARGVSKKPAAIFFHGGSRRQMLLGWNYSSYYHNAYAFNQYLASRGFVVLSVNYRSGIGYGMEFREALNYGATGASEFNDVLGAGLYLRNRQDVDPKRIALWGGSYGGYLTALGLARASDLFAAGVDLHGVHDWNVVIKNFSPNYDPLKSDQDARLAFTSSPMAFLDSWRSPVLVIHGDDDRNVPFSETVRLVEALRKKGVEVEQKIYPDEVHSFLLYRRWVETFHHAEDFLNRKLKIEP
jgi:dipeptidyl aminopeptidase/acylaminoacyl peptidase